MRTLADVRKLADDAHHAHATAMQADMHRRRGERLLRPDREPAPTPHIPAPAMQLTKAEHDDVRDKLKAIAAEPLPDPLEFVFGVKVTVVG